ncbi:hypothetical protein D6D13_01916 [Aureobasidium pullulans]|uniref:Uncharacterized protein n=1 Tax=Aureobasidium pullulans TaxID=5580 RepID=A0A4S9D730_AURPU|nr:hypothetical protein D6D13_01916 [Aureobasidium pullulans]
MPETAQSDLEHEDRIEAIAALLTQWYTLQLLSTHHPLSTNISLPPHTPSPSILSSWKTAGMSNLVMETLKQLPYLCGAERKELAPFTRALNYLDDDFAVEVWKDPFGLSEEGEKVEGYLGNCIPLTCCAGEEYGWLLLLDLHTKQKDEIYEISNNAQTQTQIRRPPKGAPKYYYQHYPHNPAPETLKSWINKTKQLLWVPDLSAGIWMQQEKDDWNGSGKYDAMKQLYFDCGWPERFDQEEFSIRYGLLSRSRDSDD